MQEIILDHIAFVAEAEDEILVPEMGIVFHQVPENRPRADLHHGLGNIVGIPLSRMPAPPQKRTTFILHLRNSQHVPRSNFLQPASPRKMTGIVRLATGQPDDPAEA